jgi:hypothetical protein
MQFELKETGTAIEVASRVSSASAALEKSAETPEQQNQVEACCHGIVEVLGAVPDDSQTTLVASGEVRDGQVLRLYVDLTVLPAAGSVVPAPAAPAAPIAETGHREEID